MVAKKILVVDYDQALLSTLHRTLCDEGFEVVLAADGKTAWEKYHVDNPDLVLMEAMLSKIHGFELCERITKQASRKVPVIIMTGVYRDRVYRTEALRTYGASEYFEKPLNLAEVLTSIHALLSTNGGRQKPGKPFEVKAGLEGGPTNGGNRNVRPSSPPPASAPAPGGPAEAVSRPQAPPAQVAPARPESAARPEVSPAAAAPAPTAKTAAPKKAPAPEGRTGSPSPLLAKTLQDLESLEKELSSIAKPAKAGPSAGKSRPAEKAGSPGEDVDRLLDSTLADFDLGLGKKKKGPASPPRAHTPPAQTGSPQAASGQTPAPRTPAPSIPLPTTPTPPQDKNKPSEPARAAREAVKPATLPRSEPATHGRPAAGPHAPETVPERPERPKTAASASEADVLKPSVTFVSGTKPPVLTPRPLPQATTRPFEPARAPAAARPPEVSKPEPLVGPDGAAASKPQARTAVPLTERPLDEKAPAAGPVEVVSRALAEAAEESFDSPIHSKLFKDIYEPEKRKRPGLALGIIAAVIVIGLAAFLALKPKAHGAADPPLPPERSLPAVVDQAPSQIADSGLESGAGAAAALRPAAAPSENIPPPKPKPSEAAVIIPKAVTQPELVTGTPSLKPPAGPSQADDSGSRAGRDPSEGPAPSDAPAEGAPPQSMSAGNDESRAAGSRSRAEAASGAGGEAARPGPKAQPGDLVPVAEADTPPETVRTVNPKYPAQALRFGREGTITVNALIDESGDVVDTGILKGLKDDMGLGAAAQAAVRKWKFRPAVKDGVDVKVWFPVVVTFRKGRAGTGTEVETGS